MRTRAAQPVVLHVVNMRATVDLRVEDKDPAFTKIMEWFGALGVSATVYH
ncbi:MAG TPA: hypothetical protein VGT04_06370 [Acidobacteriaceae bacterium]|nr:hypothetical protein [Acidobacteriaceae bacterium]